MANWGETAEDLDEVEEDIDFCDEEFKDEAEAMDLEESLAESHGVCADDDLFDSIVGRLQETVLDPEFEQLQESFLAEHSHHFTEDEENKLIYMRIFHSYVQTIEKFIAERLADVDMDAFCRMLSTRHHEIDEVLLELLLSFSDFHVFKELMLSSRRGGELRLTGEQTDEIDFEGSLCITRF
jgi:ADP-ribosylation factor 2-binding protein